MTRAAGPPDAPGREFWDRQHGISYDPGFWMADPACRRAINLRVSGDEAVAPLDFLYARSGRRRFERLLSLGCGTGRVERAVRRLDIAQSVDAVDGSAVSIDLARQNAREEGLDGIAYRVADMNRLDLPRGRYDAVVFHQSLHHVNSVERLLQQVRRTLTSTGLLFLEEWTGPSRFDWGDPAKLEGARSAFARLPVEWRQWPELKPPIEEHDPTEAVRSSAILPSLHRLFEPIVDRPYGGQIVSVLWPQVRRDAIPEADWARLVPEWLALEDAELRARPASSYYAAILARPRRGVAGVVGEAATFLVRAGLAARYRLPAMLRGASGDDGIGG